MKILSKIKKIPHILLVIASISGCMPNAEKKLNTGIELFRNGEVEKAIAYIGDGLINSAFIKKFKENQLLYGGNVLYYREESLKIVWPIELDIQNNNDYNIINYNPDTKKLGISNGYDIKIYDSEGKFINTCGSIEDEKHTIKAFIIINEKIYYYKDKRIYVCDLFSNNEQLLIDDQFFKPFTEGTYNVRFYNTEDILAIIIGIAGKYNLNIIDFFKKSIVLQNLVTASSKILFKNGEIYYIIGNAGKYSLIKMSILSKKKKNLIDFDNLMDIEFFYSGIIYENKEGIWIAEYDNLYMQRIPFNYELVGECSDRPVFKYSNIYYIVNMNILLDKIKYIKEMTPAIFDNPIKEK